jgi:DNA-damage-inducible protein J
MSTSSMVHIRLDNQLKQQATETLAAMGLSISDAVRVLLVRVIAEKQLPFELKVPNTVSRQAMAEAEDIVHSQSARFKSADELFHELEKTSVK